MSLAEFLSLRGMQEPADAVDEDTAHYTPYTAHQVHITVIEIRQADKNEYDAYS
ncbi:hypothetical protein [Paenibacillus pinistramenti]|uniref:hypothetical protein n=1 Tax=Paenibacillus pinistramenti TaxID=1768003 RepID=UPI0013967B79|nr:hypothetical protein [Paenibacillus pinistramenti]